VPPGPSRSDPRAFPPAEAVAAAADLAALETCIQGCLACPLGAQRIKFVFGEGDPAARILLVGEGPGRDEDLQGRPFVGKAGELLDKMLGAIGFPRSAVYICNVVKCRPPGNRDPQPIEIETCRPFLEAQLRFIDPAVVVTLGNFATKLLLDTKVGITKLRGAEYRLADGRVVVPTLHPSAVLRTGGTHLANVRADFVLMKRALQRAHAGADDA